MRKEWLKETWAKLGRGKWALLTIAILGCAQDDYSIIGGGEHKYGLRMQSDTQKGEIIFMAETDETRRIGALPATKNNILFLELTDGAKTIEIYRDADGSGRVDDHKNDMVVFLEISKSGPTAGSIHMPLLDKKRVPQTSRKKIRISIPMADSPRERFYFEEQMSVNKGSGEIMEKFQKRYTALAEPIFSRMGKQIN